MKPTLTVKEGAPYNPTFSEADGWTCTLHFNGRQMTVPFYMGIGHNGAEPTIDDVLECVTLDASGYDNARDFEDWCGEYGYDTDSRTAERIYKSVQRQTAKLHQLLGDQYDAIVYPSEEA